MTSAEPQQRGEGHQVVGETGGGNEVGNQIEREHQIGERGQHGEANLMGCAAIDEQLKALQGRLGQGAPRTPQQSGQQGLIDDGALQYFRFDGLLGRICFGRGRGCHGDLQSGFR